MGKACVVFAAVSIALGGLAAASAQPIPAPRALALRAMPAHSYLAFSYSRQGSLLARVDPRTLRFRKGRQLDVGQDVTGWSFSPDRSRLALGGGLGDILVVDARRLRVVRRIDLEVQGNVLATAWAGSRLIAAVAYARDDATTGLRLVTIERATGRIIGQAELSGSLQRFATASGALVLLLGPADGLGPARIVVAGADGVRTAELTRIPAGGEVERDQRIVRRAQPGLAIDPAGRRAFVVGAGTPVAEVDLETLSVANHELSTPTSLAARILDWLEPAAEAKAMPTGPVRSATWVGDGFLAVWGHDNEAWIDSQGRPQCRSTATGVRLVDTRQWSVHVLDVDAAAFAVAGDLLLTWSYTWDSTRGVQAGIGLTAYAADGSRRWQLFGAEPIYHVQVVGGRAFVRRDGSRRPTALVDLARGAVIRRQDGEPPLLLLGPAASY